ncbi:hypothetical protein ACP4OV_029494 [Aristida adscensionis]
MAAASPPCCRLSAFANLALTQVLATAGSSSNRRWQPPLRSRPSPAVPYKLYNERAFEAVELSRVDILVIPIENSSTGSIHQNYDLLLRNNLQIVREIQMDVELCLLAPAGVQNDNLQVIFSHPQELAQCELSLSNLSVTKKNVDLGASCFEIMSKQNLKHAGVIGSIRAAELYGLNILEFNFQDYSPNVTRYLALARITNLPQDYGQYKPWLVNARSKKKVMRTLDIIGEQDGIDQQALDEYAKLFGQPFTNAQVGALAALFKWSIPLEFGHDDGATIS